MSEVTTTSLGDVLGKSECYLANFAELAKELGEVVVEDDGSVIKIDSHKEVVAILQVLWDKFKETAEECEGKKIEVEMPEGLFGMITSAAVSALGFRL